MICSNYPLFPNKYDPKKLEGISNYYSDEYIQNHFKLYFTSHFIRDERGDVHRSYRLHAVEPHSIDMALAYDIKCPNCRRNNLKQIGRCLNYHDLDARSATKTKEVTIMTTFNKRDYFTGTAEYDRHFWNVMKGGNNVTDTLSRGSARESGGFYLPSGAEDKYSKAIRKESSFRNLATVIHAYNGTTRIYAKDCSDIAAWVPEGAAIPIYDAVNDFTRYPVDTHKLAVL